MTPQPEHLRRLEEVWVPNPVYFLTICAKDRKNRLANREIHAICVEVWRKCEELYGWAVGRYVIMPAHVHFFASDSRRERSLSVFIGKWKEWTAKYAARRLEYSMPLWQPEFFDHILRGSESYEQKCEYVRDNAVRAGLVSVAGDWEYQGVLNEIRSD